LESILPEMPVKDFICCPLHPDRLGKPDVHPSMLVKAGFGYCFSCGARLDAIGYLMKVRGLGFKDAVRALQ
jgi:DNA primase